ncbi:pentatricopeptide repeat-containing protein At2g22410, mitochondrial-like [Andrographis paniculata]|uniref:pentatricopeptide repeat-containing protein At2g22410, mitochondrial-like n=1 Tax=Andrographis paniculata TaxID=175694 RepID=UPI0021E6EC7B|nr:pentatricopeptide repeat-containing protein At2g22410, mitochondrial-like [Andrographis paniculata]
MKSMKLPLTQFSSRFFFRSFLTQSHPKWNSSPSPNLRITNPILLLIESCTSMSQAMQIQSHMTRTCLISHLFPVSRLLSFIALDDNGDLGYAVALFAQIPQPNVYVWNTLIRGFVRKGLFDVGFGYFARMVGERVEMDERSFVFGLKACGGLGDVRVGESVHSRVWKLGFVEAVIVRNGLIHFYCERGDLVCAKRGFDESGVRDVVTWTTMIDGMAKNGMSDDALKVFNEMCQRGVGPNEVTLVAALYACARKGDLVVGERVLASAARLGVRLSVSATNAMLDMYAKCGAMEKAGEVFEAMEAKDVFSYTCMIDGYGKHGHVELAREVFDGMPKRNVISWNAMIGGYSQNSRPKEALELFQKMEGQGLAPMESTLVLVLSACAQSSCMETGQRIYDCYIEQKRIPLTVILGNAFIDMYAKCGDIDAAKGMFDKMTRKDLVSYNSMITSYAAHGFAEKAIALFESMREVGIKPDIITFVGVLSACAHGGLVVEGWDYFNDMGLFGLAPTMEHYACMVDLLGRVGLLSKAHELIRSMPMPMEPDEGIWGALLNGARMHGDIELGKLAAEKLMALNPSDSGAYMLLAGLCAKQREWSDVRMARTLMRGKGVKKIPGSSSIEVEGEFHDFLVGDESHPESEAIYRVLEEIWLFSKWDNHSSGIDVCL